RSSWNRIRARSPRTFARSTARRTTWSPVFVSTKTTSSFSAWKYSTSGGWGARERRPRAPPRQTVEAGGEAQLAHAGRLLEPPRLEAAHVPVPGRQAAAAALHLAPPPVPPAARGLRPRC